MLLATNRAVELASSIMWSPSEIIFASSSPITCLPATFDFLRTIYGSSTLRLSFITAPPYVFLASPSASSFSRSLLIVSSVTLYSSLKSLTTTFLSSLSLANIAFLLSIANIIFHPTISQPTAILSMLHKTHSEPLILCNNSLSFCKNHVNLLILLIFNISILCYDKKV